MKKPRILLVTDTAAIDSGMGVAHKEIAQRLHATDKYEIASFGWFFHSAQQRGLKWDFPWKQFTANEYSRPYGHPVNWPNSSEEDCKNSTCYKIIEEFKPQVIIAIGDMWMCDYIYDLPNRDTFKLIHEMPIDGEPIPREWVKRFKTADVPVVMSKFGERVVKDVDKYASVEVIHRGLNVHNFKPSMYNTKDELRSRFMKGSEGKFVVGVFDRFQDRKQIQRAIEAFSIFVHRNNYTNCDLYLHCDLNDPFSIHQSRKTLTGEDGLINRYDIDHCVVVNERITVEKGVPQQELVALYNCCDVKLSASQGEGWGLCVAPDTKIQTSNGIREIHDISIGEKVLTETGSFCDVIGKTKRHVDTIYDVKISGLENVKVTEEHPFLTFRNDMFSWNNIKNISVGDYLATPKLRQKEVKKTVFDLSTLDEKLEKNAKHVWYKTGYNSDGNLKKYSRFIKLDDEFFYVSGWYLAEGTTYDNQLSLYCGEQDEEYLFRCQKWFESIGCTTRIRRNNKNLNLYITSTIISKLFTHFYSRLSGTKRIHEDLFQYGYNFLPLIESYILGDGYIQKNDISITTKSPHLAYQIKQLLSPHGVFAKIFYDNVRDYSYRIIVSGKYAKILNDKLEWDIKFTKRLGSSTIEQDNFFLSPVRKITRCNFDSNVYDICVKDTHSFVGNGVLLHNTNVEAMACGLPVIGPNYTTFPELLANNRGMLADVKTFITGMYNVERALVDTEHTAQLLEILYRSPDMRKTMGTNARNFTLQLDWQKNIQEWQRIIDDCLEANEYKLLAKSRDFYVESKDINIEGAVKENTGWAITTRGFTKGLQKAGYNVSITETGGSKPGYKLDDNIQMALDRDKSINIDIINHIPKHALEIAKNSHAQFKAVYFPYEMSHMVSEYAYYLNRHADVFMCPTSFVENVAKNAGVRNTAIVPLASDIQTENVTPVELNTKKSYKFLVLGSLGDFRKNVVTVVKAFTETFTGDDDVALILKTIPGQEHSDPSDLIRFQQYGKENPAEIEVVHSDTDDVAGFYEACDCLIQVSYAEGWGHPVFEALKFGMPIIATKYGGYLDFVNLGKNVQLLGSHTMSANQSPMFVAKEQWQFVDFAELQGALRKSFMTKQMKTRENYVSEYSWEETGKALVKALGKIDKRKKVNIYYEKQHYNMWNDDNEKGFKTYAPNRIKFVDNPQHADLQIVDITRLSDKANIKCDKYIVFMHCFGEWSEENPMLYYDLFDNAQMVYSHLNLAQIFKELDEKNKFVRGPWGCSPDKWMKHPALTNDEFIILNTGEIAETEGIKECVVASEKMGKRMIHVGKSLQYSNSSYSNVSNISVAELKDLYNRSKFVSALRRFEGFEKPAIEGLLCGCRPICFDTPLYRFWYGDLARYVNEGSEKDTCEEILNVFNTVDDPVTDEERQRAIDKFGWKTVSINFWDELNDRGILDV